MVVHKRLDYGFNGYQVPPIPRAARSSRRRCIFQRETDNNSFGAFDLLATVADKSLMEGVNSAKPVDTFSGKEQQAVMEDSVRGQSKDEPLRVMSCEPEICDQTFLFTEHVTEASVSRFCSNELKSLPNDACRWPASELTSECSQTVGSVEQLADDECKLGFGNITWKPEVRSSTCGTFGYTLEGESEKQVKMVLKNYNMSVSSRDDKCSSGCPEAWDRKEFALDRIKNSVEFPSCTGSMSCGSLPLNSEGVKTVTRDDDDNSSRCTKPRNANKASRPPQHTGGCIIRKSQTPDLKEEGYNADKKGCNFANMKINYGRQISQRDYPFKKRKLYYSGSAPNADLRDSTNEICGLPENDLKAAVEPSGPALHGGLFMFLHASTSLLKLIDTSLTNTALNAVSAMPTSAAVEAPPFQSRNSHVKLKIKSFRVPELLVEIPETATVGSLKRTVMKALTRILSGGLRVGMLLRGKKIRDDNRTLLQTGIFHDNKLDALGFMLEPKPTRTFRKQCPENHPFQLPVDSPKPLARYSWCYNLLGDILCSDSHILYQYYAIRIHSTVNAVQEVIEQENMNVLLDPRGSTFKNFPESNNDSAPSTPDLLLEKMAPGSQALIAVPETRKPLAIVPMHKSKQSDSAQRRVRRPFTVPEVEALVQAVEKLGTGRWRDVKLRAFDTVKHRTYVDLKDKWKTLVHTAKISPQQRRGESVPQELLDRVLSAHAYWCKQQTKHQIKASK